MTKPCFLFAVAALLFSSSSRLVASEREERIAPAADEQQLPLSMHAKMEQLPSIRVGHTDADLVGADQRVLQAAVDYIAGLGGGTVEIGPGEYSMRDSLHLRSNVTVRGSGEGTILKKADGVVSALALDGDFGEQQVTLRDPSGFDVGSGIAIWDDGAGGFHTTVARIVGRRGNSFAIDRPLMSDCMVANNARAATVFPVISGYELRGARVENLTVDGNRSANVYLNGCRGAGIFLYRGFETVIRNCTVRNFHGDGISFQQSNDVTVDHCVSQDNSHLGLHPGSGSQRATVMNCVARNNGSDGLFLCWRVRHGRFEDNLFEGNGQFGISIGHKDSDNVIQRNRVVRNGRDGVFFRNESYGMAAHRNQLRDNIIEDNGTKSPAAGIRIRGETHELVFENNTIRDTRPPSERTQTIGVLIEDQVGTVTLDDNEIEAATAIQDQRPKE
jgi:hypothetical protein